MSKVTGWTLRELCELFPEAFDRPIVLKDPDRRGYAFPLVPDYDLTVIGKVNGAEFVMLAIREDQLVEVEGLEAGEA